MNTFSVLEYQSSATTYKSSKNLDKHKNAQLVQGFLRNTYYKLLQFHISCTHNSWPFNKRQTHTNTSKLQSHFSKIWWRLITKGYTSFPELPFYKSVDCINKNLNIQVLHHNASLHHSETVPCVTHYRKPLGKLSFWIATQILILDVSNCCATLA